MCDNCQKFAPIYLPTTPLTSIVSPLPFATWGMDILGPFPNATGQRKYLYVAVGYFTKWIEVEVVPSITAVEVCKLIWKNFSIAYRMIFDNRCQFDTTKVTDYMSTLGC